jgi:hypothetical protein
MFIEAHDQTCIHPSGESRFGIPTRVVEAEEMRFSPGNRNPVSKRKAVDNAPACLYSLLPFAI